MKESSDASLPSINAKPARSLPSIFHHVFNSESRKVSFGWWLFIISTALTTRDEIGETTWALCMLFSTMLIGGGTVVDEMVKVLKAWVETKFGGITKPAEPATPSPTPGSPA